MPLDRVFSVGEVLTASDANNYLVGLWTPIDKRFVASGSPVSALTFSGIDSAFKMFRITYDVKCSAGQFGVRINNDSTTTNYKYVFMQASNSATAYIEDDVDNPTKQSMMLVQWTTASRGNGIYHISKPNSNEAAYGSGIGSHGTTPFWGGSGCIWNNTSALISRLDALVTTGTFYGMVALEGMRAS